MLLLFFKLSTNNCSHDHTNSLLIIAGNYLAIKTPTKYTNFYKERYKES